MKKEFLERYIPIVEGERVWSYLLFFLVTFSYKGTMALIVIPLFMLLKRKGKESYLEVLYNFGYYAITRILFSMVIGNNSIMTQGLRMLLGTEIIMLFAYKKHYKYTLKDLKSLLVKEKILIYILLIVFGGTLWNCFSAGGIKSALGYFGNTQIWLLCFLAIPYIKEKEKISRIFCVTMIFASIVSFNEIFVYHQKKIMSSVVSDGRVSSVTIGVTIYSYFFTQLLMARKPVTKFISLLCCSMWIYITIISEGRGTFLAIAIVTILIIIFVYKKRALLFLPIIACVGMILFSSNLKIVERFKVLTNGDMKNNTSYARIALIKAGLYTFEKNIIFGSGYNNTQKYFIEYRDKNFTGENEGALYGMNRYELGKMPDSHNIIIDYLAISGIFGIILSFFYIIFVPIVSLKDYLKKNYKEAILCFAGFMSFVLGGMTWSTLTRHPKGVPFLVFLLLLLIYRRFEENEYGENKS